jgi:hypothetical protein
MSVRIRTFFASALMAVALAGGLAGGGRPQRLMGGLITRP